MKDPSTADGGPVLDVHDLTVEYSSGGYAVRPLDGFDLHVPSGELVLLLGASGCGKTTLLSALAGILTPTSGTIRFDGADVTNLAGRALREYRRRTVGIVFQAFNLVPSLTARENVQAPLLVAGVRGRRARERADELLDGLGLADRRGHRPGDLSGGQQQRVAIARALVHDPPLLLADEPTAHLDYVQVDGVLRALRALAAPGRVVVVATHDDRLLPLADRVVHLSAVADGAAHAPVRVTLEPGEVLFRQGEPGDLVYDVEEGEVDLVRALAGGGEELLDRYGPGRYFGELAPLFGLQRSATARAHTRAVVTGSPVSDFRNRHREANR
jgi:putative ABC transport system ATP-binding protein